MEKKTNVASQSRCRDAKDITFRKSWALIFKERRSLSPKRSWKKGLEVLLRDHGKKNKHCFHQSCCRVAKDISFKKPRASTSKKERIIKSQRKDGG